jgi:hypothetical protein
MKEKYKLSLAVGALLQPETCIIAKLYTANPNWNALREMVVNENLLHKTRISSTFRYFLEIKRRLSIAYPFELELVAREDPATPYVLFVLCCRYYGLLGDFVREVIQDKVSIGQDFIGMDDYYHFIESKRPVHPELDTLSSTSMEKIRQVIFKMLKEVGMVNANKEYSIQRMTVPGYLVEQYKKADDLAALEYLLQRIGNK